MKFKEWTIRRWWYSLCGLLWGICPQSCFKVGHISRLSVRLLRQFLLQKRIQTWKSRLPTGSEKYPNVLNWKGKGIEIVNEIVRLSNRGQARDCRTNTNQRSNMSRGRTTSGSEGRKSRWLLSRCDNTLSYACQCNKLGTEHGVNIWHTLMICQIKQSYYWFTRK